MRAKNANFWQEILKSLGNLATWQLSNLFSTLETFKIGNFQFWQLSILAIFNSNNFQF
jgi:hypothetical protein